MSFTGIKKSPLISLPFLKKRLRRITAIGLRNLAINEVNFTVHFTLHRNEKTVAFYTSEPVENERSPEWSYLKFPTNIQCLQDFIMRIWTISSNSSRLFLEYDVHLDDCLIPDEQKDDSHRSNNSLWLEMFGYRFSNNPSIFNNQTNIRQINIEISMTDKKSKRIHFAKSYNKSSILRMINVIDAIRAENRLSTQCLERLQTFANENEDYLSKIKEREVRQARIESLRQYLQCRVSIYEQQSDANQQRQKILNEKKNRLDQNLLQLFSQQKELNLHINELNQSKFLLRDLIQLTTFRQKDIIHEIYQYVYPIITDNKKDYSIGNIKLPQAEDKLYQTTLTRERENEIAAAVGYCSHFVFIIAQFIQLPLRFPIEYYGAPSIRIHDYTLQPSDFPLYPSYDTHSFQYGLFLLNRDIGQIMYHCRVGGRQTDYRKTLENLKELMEQYFTNTPNQIHLYTFNQSLMETTVSDNNDSIIEPSLIENKQNSLFSPSLSATSSFLETNDLNHHSVDLFPISNTISPRLAMQFSHPSQQQ